MNLSPRGPATCGPAKCKPRPTATRQLDSRPVLAYNEQSTATHSVAPEEAWQLLLGQPRPYCTLSGDPIGYAQLRHSRSTAFVSTTAPLHPRAHTHTTR